jgi:hypothetical protein
MSFERMVEKRGKELEQEEAQIGSLEDKTPLLSDRIV